MNDSHSRGGARSRILRMVVTCMAMSVLMASCGDDDDSPSADGSTTTEATTTTKGDDVCADRDALSSSVDALKEVDVRAEGTNGLEEAVSAVQEDLTSLGESAGSELQPEIDAVQQAIDELGPAIDNIDDGGAAEAATAIARVATASAVLIESLQDAQCQ